MALPPGASNAYVSENDKTNGFCRTTGKRVVHRSCLRSVALLPRGQTPWADGSPPTRIAFSRQHLEGGVSKYPKVTLNFLPKSPHRARRIVSTLVDNYTLIPSITQLLADKPLRKRQSRTFLRCVLPRRSMRSHQRPSGPSFRMLLPGVDEAPFGLGLTTITREHGIRARPCFVAFLFNRNITSPLRPYCLGYGNQHPRV